MEIRKGRLHISQRVNLSHGSAVRRLLHESRRLAKQDFTSELFRCLHHAMFTALFGRRCFPTQQCCQVRASSSTELPPLSSPTEEQPRLEAFVIRQPARLASSNNAPLNHRLPLEIVDALRVQFRTAPRSS